MRPNQGAVAPIIEIAHHESKQERARDPRPHSPPTCRGPGQPAPENMRDKNPGEIVPHLFHGPCPLILRVGIADEADVPQAFHEPLVLVGGKVAIGLLLGFGGQIASQPAQVRAIRISRIIRLRVVNPVRDHIALLAETHWIRP